MGVPVLVHCVTLPRAEYKPFCTSPELAVVGPRLGEAEPSVWAASDNVSVVIILAVIFPEAYLANLKSPACLEHLAATARAARRELSRRSIEPTCVLLKPSNTPTQFFW
jgi:hypothetical protein